MDGSVYIRTFKYYPGIFKQLLLLQPGADCIFACSPENQLFIFSNLDLPDKHLPV